ncbi:MAG: hypothetical protein M1830_004753, partial [Pleopsidium flavum]
MKGIIISLVGALLSLTLSILGIYTIFRSTHLSLPLPALAPILSALIPLPNALGLWHYLRRLHSPPNANKRPTTIFTPGEILTLLTILDTILLTLAATYLSPRGLLSCALESRWRALFETHDARDIRRIQDALECCGFRSTVDKAWPFPDGEHAADACVVRYGRGRRCLEGWEGQGRGLLGVMVLVGVSTL